MSILDSEHDDACRPSRASKLDRYSAWVMLANGALGLSVALGMAALHRSAAELAASPPITSMLGVVAGVLAVRGKMAGLVAGLLFYGVQILSYYSQTFQFNFKSGISVAAVVALPHGILVVNLAALAGLAVTIWLLVRRRSR